MSSQNSAAIVGNEEAKPVLDGFPLLEPYRRMVRLRLFEHKRLYNHRGPVPLSEYLVPFGRAVVVRPGTEVTIVATGNSVLKSIEAAEVLANEDISAQELAPRRLAPLDREAILASVAKTGRLVIVDENSGERFAAGEPLVEIETDKVTIDIEATEAGHLPETLVPLGTPAPGATVIARYAPETQGADLNES